MRREKRFCDKKFRSMLVTATFAMAIEYLKLLTANIIAGHMLGEQAIAGINLVAPVFSLIAFIATVICVGTSICYSYEMGRFDKEQANSFFGQGVILSIGAGAALFLLGFFGRDLFFRFLSPSNEVYRYANGYYQYLLLTALIAPVYATLSDMVYGAGDGLICNISFAAQVTANVLLSIFLCRAMGISGISLGAFLSCVIGTIIQLLHFLRKGNTLQFKWHLKWKDLRQVFKYSIVDAALYLNWAILLFVLNKFIISRFGDEALYAFSVIINIFTLTIVFDGIGQAIQPLINVYRGEKNTKGVRQVMRIAQKTALLEGLFLTFFLLIYPESVAHMVGVRDIRIIAITRTAVRIMAATLAFSSFVYLFSSYYLITDKIPLALLMSCQNDLVMPLGLSILLGLAFGINGVWAGLALGPVMTILVTALIVYWRYNRANFPLLLDKARDELIFSSNLVLTPENIMSLVHQEEDLLKRHGVCQRTIYRVSLLIEETFMLITEKNPGKHILAECTTDLNEEVCLILRDSGVIFDITDTDLYVSSLRAYVVAGVMVRQKKKAYLTTTGYNRNVFRLSRSDSEQCPQKEG